METKRKSRIGRVVSDKMDKTVVVAVETTKHHPFYKKTIKKVVNCKAHDAKNECGQGDTVMIIETRPLSKDKRWRVVEILSRKEALEVEPEEVV